MSVRVRIVRKSCRTPPSATVSGARFDNAEAQRTEIERTKQASWRAIMRRDLGKFGLR